MYRQRRRGIVKFPTNLTEVKRSYRRKVPIAHWRKAVKGSYIPVGRIHKEGLTEEEKLMRYAPKGSAPERLMYGWLITHDIPFTFQEPVMGGRLPGGAVIDFVLYSLYTPIAIRIQSYWHESAQAIWSDEIQKARLEELGFIVEDVWEWEINTINKLHDKMREILYGFNKRMGTSLAVAPAQETCPYCGLPECRRIHIA